MSAVPPGRINRLVFDMTLPTDLVKDGSTQALFWHTALPSTGGIAVKVQEILNLVVNLATVLRMRNKGGVSFKTIYDEAEHNFQHGNDEVDKVLRRLSDSRRPR